MGEAGLSLSSLLSVAAPVTTVDPATVTLLSASGGGDPFAELLSTLVTGGTTGAIQTPAAPVATTVPIAALPGTGDPSAETSDLTPPTSDGDSDDDKTADPLADAIAQGLTAVLALGQPAPPPPPPVPVTVAVSAPTSAAIAAVAAPIVASVLPPATTAPTTDADAPPVTADGAAKPAPAADGTPSPAAKPAAPPPADYSPAVIMTLRAAAEAARPAEAAAAAAATPPAAPDQPAAPTDEAAAAVASSAAPRQPVRAPRAPGLAGRIEAAATAQRTARTDMRRLAETAQPAALATAFADRAQAPIAADPNAAGASAAPADVAFQQQLNVAQDGQWLDSLARDIATSAGTGNDLHFKLNPPNLGALTVQIAQGAEGASIRLTTDSSITHAMLIDAQPRLVAEARAQGLKVADTNVDLSQQQSGGGSSAMRQGDGSAGQNGQNRQPLPDHQPFSRSTGTNNQSAESEADSDALYA